MSPTAHYAALQRMYQAAPINAFYRPSIEVRDGEAVIEIEASEKLHHAAGAVHGSVCFKLLDDAAFFASASLETEVFVLTSSFTIYLLRPVVSGTLRATGRVLSRTASQFIAESVVRDENGAEVARGSGVFVRSRIPLAEAHGYAG